MIRLSDEQIRALDAATDAPARVIDANTKRIVVLLKSADFDWIRGLLGDEPDAPRVVDSRNSELYAAVPLDRYERFKAFFEEDPITPAERARFIQTWGERAGWNDRAFDIYNEIPLPENRP